MKKTIRVKCCKCNHAWESPIVIVGYVKKFYISVEKEDKVVEYIACPNCCSVVGALKEEK